MKNIKDNIIMLPNRELKISDELVKLAKLASSEYKYGFSYVVFCNKSTCP